ncbi:MAG: ABC transporter ATP-binding protein [Anaerolineales bacterium]|nr:MAG: ABC transporter ATP-binding protein [Anaerolineales bacterium]
MGFHGGRWGAFIRYDEQEQPQLSWRLLRRVAEYARPYRLKLVVVLITMVGISLISLIPPLLIRDFIDHAIPARDTARLNWLALGMVAVPLINGLLGVAQRYMSSFVGEGIIFDLRSALYAHLQRMGLRFYTNTQVGEMMSRLNNDVIGAQRAVTGTLVTLLSNTFAIVTTLIIMFSMEWRLTLLGVAILPLFVIPARRVGTVLRGIARRSMEINARMNAMMNETLNISGAILVKIFGRYHSEVDRFRGHAQEVRDIGVRQAVIGRWFYLSLGLASAIGSALVFLVGGHLVLQGAFTIGTIVAFSTYLGRLYGPLTAMTNARVDLATSMVSFERVFEVLDLPIEIRESPDAIDLVDPQGGVSFDEVCFSYEHQDGAPVGLEEQFRFARRSHTTYIPPKVKSEPSDEKDKPEPRETRWAVQDVSFEIQPGSMAALVGPSGAGKTTITYLLPRLFDPTSGRIMIDGYDLRDLSLDTIAKHIGMVTQETYLFHTTIRDNLRYAKTDATQDELDVACRAANIHDFIRSLPEGYDTVVGERGYRLSGGEKQRVAIARVLLKDPKILILDEATSHLDSLSEALIKNAMQVVRKGRTSLVIAHRLSTVINADLILVMDKGRLVERGGHEDLLEHDGIYADLYQTQFFPEGSPG